MYNTRYNTFNQVHKGLRAFMFDTAMKLQQTDLNGDSASQTVMEQLTELIDTFEGHAHHEDNFFNAPLEVFNPDISSLFEKEHAEDHRLGIAIKTLMTEWVGARSSYQKQTIGKQLQYAFNEFVAFNLYHMNKEEIELNKFLWIHYTDQEIMATEERIVQSIPPQKMMASMRWMVKGINDSELVAWINGVRLHAPAQVYAILISIAEHELEPARWTKVERMLHRESNAFTNVE